MPDSKQEKKYVHTQSWRYALYDSMRDLYVIYNSEWKEKLSATNAEVLISEGYVKSAPEEKEVIPSMEARQVKNSSCAICTWLTECWKDTIIPMCEKHKKESIKNTEARENESNTTVCTACLWKKQLSVFKGEGWYDEWNWKYYGTAPHIQHVDCKRCDGTGLEPDYSDVIEPTNETERQSTVDHIADSGKKVEPTEEKDSDKIQQIVDDYFMARLEINHMELSDSELLYETIEKHLPPVETLKPNIENIMNRILTYGNIREDKQTEYASKYFEDLKSILSEYATPVEVKEPQTQRNMWKNWDVRMKQVGNPKNKVFMDWIQIWPILSEAIRNEVINECISRLELAIEERRQATLNEPLVSIHYIKEILEQLKWKPTTEQEDTLSDKK